MSSVQDRSRHAPPLGYVLAAAAGSSQPAETALAPHVRAWFASPEQGLAAQIESAEGPTAATDALARLAPSTLTVCATVVTGNACWAEVIRDGDREPPETCIVGLSCDSAGSVSRLVWLRAPLAPTQEVDRKTSTLDGRPILERYLTDLSVSKFTDAAAHFTVDTIYSHPPYAGGTERVLFRGREALAHGFAYDRGPSPVRQVITDLWQRGGRMFVEGVIEGIPNGGTFFSTAEISPDGEIARYVAFYSATRIPRLHP